METPRHPAAWAALLLAGLAVTAAGWWALYFVCDDAYITFRYISSRRLGWGYVWNPPPFHPVEGYTSWLWMVILDGVWTLTGVEPPEAAPRLGLLCGLASTALALRLLAGVPLPPALAAARLPLAAVGLAGVVTNRTFLTWTSSGLETPLFVTLLLAWAVWAQRAGEAGRAWPVAGMALASALTLTRPDGLLFVAATGAVVAAARWRDGGLRGGEAWMGLPLAAPTLHLLWRRATYGEWLPNTWFAKVAEPWLAGGGNQFWLYVLEYALFAWVPLAAWVGWRHRRSLGTARAWTDRAPELLAAAAFVAHGAYYVLRVGGDHFGFRIFAHVPALLMALTLWLVARSGLRRLGSVLVVAILVVGSWTLSWPNWLQTLPLTTEDEVKKLRRPLAPFVPAVIRPWAAAHDHLEDWCVRHLVASPHQTHKWFRRNLSAKMPSREEVLEAAPPSLWDDGAEGRRARPVIALYSVGVPAWSMPTVAVIDRFGLNDRVIARNRPPAGRFRYAAHDRFPPDGYIPCFRPNVDVFGGFVVRRRRQPLTADQIRACEAEFLQGVREGRYEASPQAADDP